MSGDVISGDVMPAKGLPDDIVSDAVPADSDSDTYEDHEMHVVMEIGAGVDRQLLDKSFSFQLVGLDEKKPVLQLGNLSFVGRYDDLSSSVLVLQERQEQQQEQKHHHHQKEQQQQQQKESTVGQHSWTPLGFFDKVLRMERVFMHPKESSSAGDCSKNLADEAAQDRQGVEAGKKPIEDPDPRRDNSEPQADSEKRSAEEHRTRDDDPHPSLDVDKEMAENDVVCGSNPE